MVSSCDFLLQSLFWHLARHLLKAKTRLSLLRPARSHSGTGSGFRLKGISFASSIPLSTRNIPGRTASCPVGNTLRHGSRRSTRVSRSPGNLRSSPISKAPGEPASAARWASPVSPTWTWFAIQRLAKIPYISRVMLHYTIPLEQGNHRGHAQSSVASLHGSRQAPGTPPGKDEHRRFFRPELRRQRQPSAVHELGDREQRRLRLCRRHARLHLWAGGGSTSPKPGPPDLARC